MAIPIFDFNEGNVKKAEISLRKLYEEEINAKNRVWISLVDAWENLAFLYFEANRLRDSIIPSAKEAYNETLQRFDKGRGTYLDVLDAQRSFFEARSEYLNSLEGFQLKSAEVERIIARKIADYAKQESVEGAENSTDSAKSADFKIEKTADSSDDVEIVK